MVQLLFARLPQFKDDTNSSKQVKDLTTKNHQRIHEQINTTGKINFFFLHRSHSLVLDTTPETIFPDESELIDQAKVENAPSPTILPIVIPSLEKTSTNEPAKGIERSTIISKEMACSLIESLTPYGWPCVRGLFRFLTELINNYDKSVHSFYLLLLIIYFL